MIQSYNKKEFIMKNVLLVLATVLSLTACEKDDKSVETTTVDVVDGALLAQDVTATTVDVAEAATPDVLVSEPDAVTGTSEVTPTK